MKARLIIILLSLISAVSCVFDDPEKNVDLQVGDNVPNFTVLLSDGTAVSSSEMNDGVALIMFFHTGCKDCQNTLPEVQKIYDEYASKGVRFALVSRSESESSIISFWDANGLTMPYSAQKDRSVYELFAKEGIPRVYICEKGGIIRYIHTDNPVPSYDDLKYSLESVIH